MGRIQLGGHLFYLFSFYVQFLCPLVLAKAIPFSFKNHPPFTAQPQWPVIHGALSSMIHWSPGDQPRPIKCSSPTYHVAHYLPLQIYIQISFLREAMAHHISKHGTPHVPHPSLFITLPCWGFHYGKYHQIPTITFVCLLILCLSCWNVSSMRTRAFLSLMSYRCLNTADHKH